MTLDVSHYNLFFFCRKVIYFCIKHIKTSNVCCITALLDFHLGTLKMSSFQWALLFKFPFSRNNANSRVLKKQNPFLFREYEDVTTCKTVLSLLLYLRIIETVAACFGQSMFEWCCWVIAKTYWRALEEACIVRESTSWVLSFRLSLQNGDLTDLRAGVLSWLRGGATSHKVLCLHLMSAINLQGSFRKDS